LAFRNAARIMAETGCAGVKLKGRRGDGAHRPLPRRARHPGAGPWSAPAAIDQRAGRVPRPRPEEAEAPKSGRRPRGRGGRRLRPGGRGTAEPVARRLTAEVSVPTIGIGASPACDGQNPGDEICWVCSTSSSRASSSAMPSSRLGCGGGGAYAEDVRARASPVPSTPTPSPQAPRPPGQLSGPAVAELASFCAQPLQSRGARPCVLRLRASRALR